MRPGSSRAGFLGGGLLRLAISCAALLAAPHWASADDKPQDISRIVSIGGDVTEVLFALGLGANVVAVDTTSEHPREALAAKKSVGYMRALSSEGVLSMNPTLIIASGGAGPPEVVAALKATPVPYIEVRCEDTPDGVAKKVRLIAGIVGAKDKGDALAQSIEADFKTLAEERAKITKPIHALYIIAVQNGRAIVGGTHTGADAIIHLAGAENVAAGIEGFKPLSDEAALSMAPDVIVMMQGRPGGGGASEIAAMPGLSATPAVKSGRILEFGGSYLLQFGPRAASAARALMQAFQTGAAVSGEK
jgi:iron complex transport system substrate-binding protein